MNHQALESRLMDFVALLVAVFEKAGTSVQVLYFKDQAFRAATSALLCYSEAQSAESRKDFSHKCSLVLKELRESHTCLRMLQRLKPTYHDPPLVIAIDEANQLVAIFTSTIKSLRIKPGDFK